MRASECLKIDDVGAQGDGVAVTSRGQVYVPGGLPGETWQDGPDGALQRVGSPSIERRTAPCPHFDRCGGCRTQHMTLEFYRSWKRGLLITALTHHGISADIEPLVSVTDHSRRRAKFQFDASSAEVALGFHEVRSHAIVDLQSCLVMDEAIVAALPTVRTVLKSVSGIGSAAVTVLNQGLAVGIQTSRKEMPATLRQKIIELTKGSNIHWLSVNGENVMARQSPQVTVNGATLTIVPDVFLQAVPAAEVEIAGRLVTATQRAKKIADLFCGVGTFTFPLAKQAPVTAFDSGSSVVETLQAAVRHNAGYKPIEVRRRDLSQEPLSMRELEAFDAVVLDPPRFGAAAQMERLARSQVATVAMVSCQPTSFARDARTLIDGGYVMKTVTPIDQFLYTEHLEVVGIFQRSRTSRKRRSI
jgi:23S rRNA (uracil1939-C5)-methyltransferase